MKIEISGIRTLVNDPGGVEFEGLSVITGKNSSGKTTYTSAIKMLQAGLRGMDHQNCLEELIDHYNHIDYRSFAKGVSRSNLVNKSNNNLIYRITDKHNQTVLLNYEYSNSGLHLKELELELDGIKVFSLIKTKQLGGFEEGTVNEYYFELAALIKYFKQDLIKAIDHVVEEYNISSMSYIGNLEMLIKEFIDHNPANLYKLSELIEFINNGLITPKFSIDNNGSTYKAIKNRILSLFNNYRTISEWKNMTPKDLGSILYYKLKNEDDIVKNYFYSYEMDLQGSHGIMKSDSFLLLIQKVILILIERNISLNLNALSNIRFISNVGAKPIRIIDLTEENLNAEFIRFISGSESGSGQLTLFKSNISKFNKFISTLGIEGKLTAHIDNVLNVAGLYIQTGKQMTNITDLGTGHYYCLTIAMQIYILYRWYHAENMLQESIGGDGGVIELVITEPEFGLHPDLQSKFCSFICDIIALKEKDKTKINIILETHSTIIIDTIRLEIVKRKIKPESCRLYYFDKIEDETIIRKISIDKDGMLSDRFGEGFLDMSNLLLEQRLKVKFN